MARTTDGRGYLIESESAVMAPQMPREDRAQNDDDDDDRIDVRP